MNNNLQAKFGCRTDDKLGHVISRSQYEPAMITRNAKTCRSPAAGPLPYTTNTQHPAISYITRTHLRHHVSSSHHGSHPRSRSQILCTRSAPERPTHPTTQRGPTKKSQTRKSSETNGMEEISRSAYEQLARVVDLGRVKSTLRNILSATGCEASYVRRSVM